MDQFACPGSFVAAHGLAGGPVAGGQGGQVLAGQDAVGGGGGNTAAGGQPHRSDAVLAPQAYDVFLGSCRGAARLVVRAAGTVTHALGAQLSVTRCPAGGGGVADLETLGCSAQRPAVVNDAPGQTQSASRGQRSITVGHEVLLSTGADAAIRTEPRRTSPVQAPSTRVTNVPGQHT